MRSSFRPWAALLAAALSLPGAARAQFSVPPGAAYNVTPDTTQLLTRPVVPAQPYPFAYRPDLYGYPTYGAYPYYGSPVGDTLRGVADLTTSSAYYQLTLQQARQQSEAASQARLDTRRKLFDELRYEQLNTPTLEDLREKDFQTRVQRSRSNPPQTEIWSAVSINDMLLAVQRAETYGGVRGPAVPVDPDVLRRINVTTGTTNGSMGMFRNEGRIRWPLALGDPRFDAERDRIGELAQDAVKQLKMYDAVDVKTLRELQKNVEALRARVDASVKLMTPADSIKASRFVTQLSEAVKTLADPGASNYFNGKWQLKGNTMAEVVDYMTTQGLKFAPASDGDEAAYSAFYRSLQAYDAGLVRLVGPYVSLPPPPRP